VTRVAPGPATYAAVALGGALGATARWWLGDIVPDGDGFPWTTFAINVTGSLALALLPVLAAVRRRPTLAAGLGPGVLGGYPTLSAYAEQSRALVGDGRATLAAAYLLGTLAACLAAVVLAGHLSSLAGLPRRRTPRPAGHRAVGWADDLLGVRGADPRPGPRPRRRRRRRDGVRRRHDRTRAAGVRGGVVVGQA
jgi:CrcB protein